jgi:hypothetical protein
MTGWIPYDQVPVLLASTHVGESQTDTIHK